MNESLVLCKDISQKLVEAGLYIDSTFAWVRCEDVIDAKYFAEDGKWVLVMVHGLITLLKPNAVKYPASLTDELLRVMPAEILSKGDKYYLYIEVFKLPGGGRHYECNYHHDYRLITKGSNLLESNTMLENLGSLLLVPEVLAVVKQNMKEQTNDD